MSLTYHDLYRGSARYATRYRCMAVGRGEAVLIALPHGPDLLYAFFGALLVGCVPSFMPLPTSKQDLALFWASHRQVFERIESGAFVTCRANAADVGRALHGLAILMLLSEDLEPGRGEGLAPVVAAPSKILASLSRQPQEIAFLQHSSGTTGVKKGVALSFAAVDRQIEGYAASIGLGDDDCVVSWLPLYHDMGLIACLVLPFVRRVPVVWLDPFEWVGRPVMLFEAIAAHRGTLVWLPNFAFHHLARTVSDSARVDLGGVRAFIDCSEPCKAETFDLFAERFASWGLQPEQLQVCYAMAEAVFAVTQTTPGRIPPRIDQEGHTLLSVGRPLDDWHVRILDGEGRPVPAGSVGQVAITGGSLFSGYYRQPEDTARKFRGEWYLTGDLGCLRDGELYITGRTDDLIIVHGKNFYAHDIEFAVNQVPGVKPGRAVAIGVFAPEAGTQELLIIAETTEPPERRPGLAKTVKVAVMQHTSLAPRTVHVVEAGWLVKTTSGKINRLENLRKYLTSKQVVA